MSIAAIYENGVFKPLEPVNLPEATRVDVSVSKEPTSEQIEAVMRRFGRKAFGIPSEDFNDPLPEFEAYYE